MLISMRLIVVSYVNVLGFGWLSVVVSWCVNVMVSMMFGSILSVVLIRKLCSLMCDVLVMRFMMVNGVIGSSCSMVIVIMLCWLMCLFSWFVCGLVSWCIVLCLS